MLWSLLPVLRNVLFHATAQILPSCPLRVLTILDLVVSHIYRSPVWVPTAKWFPSRDHWTLVTLLFGPMSLNLVTLLLVADHR